MRCPCQSLQAGKWFKLICGASFQDLPAIRNLVLAYTLAGADCIDVAADVAVVAAAREGLKTAEKLAGESIEKGFPPLSSPWLMVSLNDAEDPHFRKAVFDSALCPSDCPRPCQQICPAQAIAFSDAGSSFSGVIEQRCYGCGRCLPVCPSQLIKADAHVSSPKAIAPLIAEGEIDALEIHTQVGHEGDFRQLWQELSPYQCHLKLLAISCPDGPAVIDYLYSLHDFITPLPCLLLWQTDGRPMSGDIGRGTTHATFKLAQNLLAAGLPGFIQLAGGTNDYTVSKLRSLGLLKTQNRPFVAGIAYGSYARSLLSPILKTLEERAIMGTVSLEACPDLLWQAVSQAHSLVSQIKSA